MEYLKGFNFSPSIPLQPYSYPQQNVAPNFNCNFLGESLDESRGKKKGNP